MELYIYELRKELNAQMEEMRKEVLVLKLLQQVAANAHSAAHMKNRAVADVLNPFLPCVALNLPEESGFDFGIIHDTSVDADGNFSFLMKGYADGKGICGAEKYCSLEELIELNRRQMKTALPADKLIELRSDLQKAKERASTKVNEYQECKLRLKQLKNVVKKTQYRLAAFLCPFYPGDLVSYRDDGSMMEIHKIAYCPFDPWGYKVIFKRMLFVETTNLLAFNQELILQNLEKKQHEVDALRAKA